MLRSLVLTRYDDARGQVRDANRGIGDVDVLAAGAARAVRVDADVFVFDLDVDVFGQLGPHEQRCERSVTPCRLIEGRDADEAVDSGFGR